MAVAAAQILFQRFWFVTSMKQFGVGVSFLIVIDVQSISAQPIDLQDVGMGALYLASKLEECPLRMRDLINVYDLLLQRAAHSLSPKDDQEFHYHPMSYFGSTFYDLKDSLVLAEMQILKRLGFNVHVVLPYGTLINYLRVLGLTSREDACTRAWGYLNDAYVCFIAPFVYQSHSQCSHQTPVYALYQIPTIVCASIFLTVRELQIPLPSKPPVCWWELFDANWDDVWSVSGCIMRLYRRRTPEENRRVLGMVTKKEVRKWLEDNATPSS